MRLDRQPDSDRSSPAGVEWLVEGLDCDPDRLRDLISLRRVCDRILGDLGLRPVRDGVWHQFPGPAGVTGLYLLAESHLTCHTYPEFGVATFNLYCCRSRPPWPWAERLAEMLGAGSVTVRVLDRGRVRAEEAVAGERAANS